MRRLFLALVLCACSAPSTARDAGADAFATDTFATDTSATDTFATDTFVAIDAPLGDASGHDAGGSDAGRAITGTIVPLYTDPSSATWTRIASAATAHPTVRVVAVINPNNGPTPTRDPSYATGITALRAAGVVVVGYVATGYGTRATASVDTDVDRYRAQYTDLDGIFFDEAAIYETGHETTYTHEASHARAAGYGFLIANPGTAPDPAYDGLFDVAMVYESGGAPAASTLARYAAGRAHAAIFPYAVASLDATYVAAIRSDVAYVYLTNDDLPNPWDTLPPYLDALLTALE